MNMTIRALDLPFIWSVGVNDLVLAYLKTLFDGGQFLGVKTLVLQRQVACEFVVPNAQVHAWVSHVLNGVRRKRLLALNFDLLLSLSIDIDCDVSTFNWNFSDTEIMEFDALVFGEFVNDPEGRISMKSKASIRLPIARKKIIWTLTTLLFLRRFVLRVCVRCRKVVSFSPWQF